jgi:hypothetical protein
MPKTKQPTNRIVAPARAVSRTSWSVNTLQEQTIIANHQLAKHVGE